MKDSIRIVRALRAKLGSLRSSDGERGVDDKDIGLFVMADTTYGSCCVDEVGASHIDADCVIHYGHTCLSPWVLINLTFFVSFFSCSLLLFSFTVVEAVSGRVYNIMNGNVSDIIFSINIFDEVIKVFLGSKPCILLLSFSLLLWDKKTTFKRFC